MRRTLGRHGGVGPMCRHATPSLAWAIVPGMLDRAQIRLLFAGATLALAALREVRRPGPLPVVIVPEATLAAAPLVPEARQLEPEFGMRMTPDDVARGVWALAQGGGPGLSPEQASRLLEHARVARQARREVDSLRRIRRARRAEARAEGAQLAATLTQLGWTPGERQP